MFKLYMAAGSVICGSVIAAFQLYQGHLVWVFFYILCGLAAGWAWLRGFPETIFDPVYFGAASVIGAIGLYGLLHYSNATNFDLQRGYAGALSGMAQLTETCHPIRPELSKIAEHGLMACGGQNLNDISALTFELEKGLHLGPGLSLVDGAHDLSKDPSVNQCARLFKIADHLCPYSFQQLDTKSRAALLAAAQ